ncbi:hypothetical protein [uncultured Tateyamaria sp.]|uniref:hypothetical protein n=1 Tax=uncultured Tateyamaria sp. TaxID=455651 RepID=UPI002617D71E|nr:hypothetical protein [uncultured Tateyamaria sp.]
MSRTEIPLLNETMHDGSRHFLFFPQKYQPIRLWFSVVWLAHAFPTKFIPSLDETWFDFTHMKRSFSVSNPHGDYWFFANDPNTPDAQLEEIRTHFLAYT